MIGAGALEIDAGVAVNEGFFADDHGVDERGLRRRPERVHFGDDARVNVDRQSSTRLPAKPGKTSTSSAFAEPRAEMPFAAR